MLKFISRLFGAAEPASAPVPEAAAPAPAKRQDRRKLKRAKRRASPGARKIDPNGPWLEQARGAKR
ncbi:hypothetical protein [Ralstonia pseudosolanacearum]|uniref:Uncharacterized protein n=1 Tax=Ralstonia solanacearum TaxID=305 RepID=A0ABY6N9H3_RALSL|nr:hypothetical protein [Ralstonia sp. RS650]UZF13807.1 hypothetical protein LH706_12200 [Ralstonia solanacearum]UZF28871.1 hypothetical protein LGV82_11835 [Ralstonia sp. RS650]